MIFCLQIKQEAKEVSVAEDWRWNPIRRVRLPTSTSNSSSWRCVWCSSGLSRDLHTHAQTNAQIHRDTIEFFIFTFYFMYNDALCAFMPV